MQGDSGSNTQEYEKQKEACINNAYTTQTVALYNLGVEHEYLNEYTKAIEYFNKAQYIT